MTKKKALVLIDYENLAGGGRNHGLEIKKEGFKHFVDYLNSSYEIEDGMLNVVCRFDDFTPGLQRYFQSLSCDTIDAIDLGKDVADGYVIIAAVTKLVKIHDSIDEVVLVGGDNVYAGLVRTVIRDFHKSVKVISWKKCLAESLTTINQTKVQVEYTEDIFEVGTNKHLENGWFDNDDCTSLEFAAISFIANSKFSDNYELHTLVDRIIASPDSRVSSFSEFHYTKKWFMDQTGASDLFIKERIGSRWHLKLNPENHKVQLVLSRISVSETK